MCVRCFVHYQTSNIKRGRHLMLTCQQINSLQDLYSFFSTLSVTCPNPQNYADVDHEVNNCLQEIEEILSKDFLERMSTSSTTPRWKETHAMVTPNDVVSVQDTSLLSLSHDQSNFAPAKRFTSFTKSSALSLLSLSSSSSSSASSSLSPKSKCQRASMSSSSPLNRAILSSKHETNHLPFYV